MDVLVILLIHWMRLEAKTQPGAQAGIAPETAEAAEAAEAAKVAEVVTAGQTLKP